MPEQTPFLWGQGGTRLTPEDIAAQRKIAQSLMTQGMDYSPVQSPWQGAARMAQALLGGYQSGEADRASTVNGLESTALRNEAMGLPMAASAPVAPAVSAAPASAPAMPTGQNVAAIRAGLLERGLPEHVADGFLMNFKDESGFNPGLNEAAPIVPGSRGGYGLAQWTGPRRVGLEQFAASKGLPVSDINLQLDYLSNELKGSEAPAAQKIMATSTPGDAAAVIARSFLRPAQEHLDRRVAQYTGGDGAALPQNAREAQGYAIPGQPAATPGINPAIAKLISSPYAREGDKQIGMLLFKNQLETQQKAADPLRQGQIAAQPIELRGKELSNMKLERELQGEGAVPLTPEDRASYGIPEGQPAYKTRSGEIKFGPAGTKITTNVGGGSDEQVFKAMDESAKAARSSVTGLAGLQEARAAIKGGAFTGFGANQQLAFRKAASALGLADSDKVVNTETFKSAIAPQVAAMVKSTVGTANISNSDREFAEKAAGGNITLDEGSINRLLGIMERASVAQIKAHQQRLEAVYPDAAKNPRERALFGVDSPPPQVSVRRFNPATGRIE